MGITLLFKFSLICIDFLAWPIIALGYPLFASIRAIETGSKYHMRKLVIYWTLFACITLFEYVFLKIIVLIPFWHNMKLIATLWLVMHRFGGACHAYQSIVRPCLSVDLQAFIDSFYKPKEEKSETFLDAAEKYIEENGSEALEKLIESKVHWKCIEPDNSQRNNQVLEPEVKSATATSIQLKEPDDILEGGEKSAATEAKQVIDAEVKDSTPVKEVQLEWNCALCQVKITSEKMLNDHLQGNIHKSNCESLKTSKLFAKDAQVPEEKNAAATTRQKDDGILKAAEKTVAAEIKQVQHTHQITLAPAPKGTNAAVDVKETPTEENATNRKAEKTPPSKEVQQEWSCAICGVTTTSEKTLNHHFRGKKHKSKCVSTETSKLFVKDAQILEPEKKNAAATSQQVQHSKPIPAGFWAPKGANAATEIKETMTTQEEASVTNMTEWSCALCQLTTMSEKTLNVHLNGKKHKSKCESLIASKAYAPKVASKTIQHGGGPVNQPFKHWCSVCDVRLLSEVDVASHLRGKLHSSNVDKIVKS